MKTWKIEYWHCGDYRVKKLKADSKYSAKLKFYVTNPRDDIIRIEEVKDNV